MNAVIAELDQSSVLSLQDPSLSSHFEEAWGSRTRHLLTPSYSGKETRALAHSLLIQARKDVSGRMPLEDHLRRWGCWLTLPSGSHTHTPLKETVGGLIQEGNNSDHLELGRIREAGAYVDDTVLTQCRPRDIHLPSPRV